MTEPKLITWSGIGHPEIDPMTPVRPVHRGKEDPAKGIRITLGLAIRFDWSHDGGRDDIIAYRIVEAP